MYKKIAVLTITSLFSGFLVLNAATETTQTSSITPVIQNSPNSSHLQEIVNEDAQLNKASDDLGQLEIDEVDVINYDELVYEKEHGFAEDTGFTDVEEYSVEITEEIPEEDQKILQSEKIESQELAEDKAKLETAK